MKKSWLFLLLLILAITQSIAQRKQVAILIFDGVQIIDYTGPYEVLGQAGFNVFTVAQRKTQIITSMGMKVVPNYDFSDMPDAEIMVLPGGRVPHSVPESDSTVVWIKKIADRAEYILSVCNGAFWLTSARLLDGKEATTTAGMISHLNMFSPDTKPVYDRRFVESGKIVTAGGLSAGIDGALHIVSKIHGAGRAQEVANNMEYNWQKGDGYVRTQLADFPFSGALDFNPPLRNRETLQYRGSDREWIAEYKVPRQETLSEFYTQFATAAGNSGWKKVEEERLIGVHSIWEKTDFAGRKWRCEVQLENTVEKGIIYFKLQNTLVQ